MMICVWPGVVASGASSRLGLSLVSVTLKFPWFGAPSVKLVLICSPLPTVTAPTVIVGVWFVIVRVAADVATYAGIVALTVVGPRPASGWKATPPDVVSVGEFA